MVFFGRFFALLSRKRPFSETPNRKSKGTRWPEGPEYYDQTGP